MNTRRALTWIVAACSLALFAPILYPLVAGRVFTYADLSWFHLPMRFLYQEAMRAGDTVLWTPSVISGVYLLGEGQVGVFHPLHQVLYRALPLQVAFGLELALVYPAALSGMYLLLRRLQIGAAASLFGGMLFAFSGFNLLHYLHPNMIAVVAHMPWLLVAADLLMLDDTSRRRRLAFAAIALVVASELLLGFPQAVVWSLMTLAAFIAFRARERAGWSRPVACGVAVVIGVLLGGIQVLPTADASMHSTRTWLAPEFALSYSLHPINLAQLWSPYFLRNGAYRDLHYVGLHEFGIYSGAILPIALIWVWMRRDAVRERRTLVMAVTLFAAAALFLALGRYSGLDFVLTRIPLLNSLRAPARYIVLVQFALAVLAATAFDDLLDIVEGRRPAPGGRLIALWMPAAFSLVTTVVLNAGLLPDRRRLFAGLSTAAPGAIIVFAVTALVVLAAQRTRIALVTLVFVTTADLGAWGIRFIYRNPPQTIEELTTGIPPAPDRLDEARAATDGPVLSDLLVMKGYRLTSGYVGLFPASFYPLNGRSWRTFSGTRWLFTPDGFRYPAENGVARVRLLDQSGRETGGVARLVTDRPGHLVAELQPSGPGILAITERFHDGWVATSDDRPLATVPVNSDFLGCVVDAGVRRVAFRFEPRSYRDGRIVSAAGLILLLAGVVFVGRSSPR